MYVCIYIYMYIYIYIYDYNKSHMSLGSKLYCRDVRK